jgi:hypothetical protein
LQEILPDDRSRDTLGRDVLIVDEVGFDHALEAAGSRVSQGWRIIALRVERDRVPQADRSRPACARR